LNGTLVVLSHGISRLVKNFSNIYSIKKIALTIGREEVGLSVLILLCARAFRALFPARFTH
jgi:hypothetical protein